MKIPIFIFSSLLISNIISTEMKITNVSFPINCNKYFKGTYQFNITLLCDTCENTPSIEEDILLPLQDGNVDTPLNATCYIKNTNC